MTTPRPPRLPPRSRLAVSWETTRNEDHRCHDAAARDGSAWAQAPAGTGAARRGRRRSSASTPSRSRAASRSRRPSTFCSAVTLNFDELNRAETLRAQGGEERREGRVLIASNLLRCPRLSVEALTCFRWLPSFEATRNPVRGRLSKGTSWLNRSRSEASSRRAHSGQQDHRRPDAQASRPGVRGHRTRPTPSWCRSPTCPRRSRSSSRSTTSTRSSSPAAMEGKISVNGAGDHACRRPSRGRGQAARRRLRPPADRRLEGPGLAGRGLAALPVRHPAARAAEGRAAPEVRGGTSSSRSTSCSS